MRVCGMKQKSIREILCDAYGVDFWKAYKEFKSGKMESGTIEDLKKRASARQIGKGLKT